MRRWKAKFPDYIAVGYVNTTAEVKAELDYCCTSGNVLDVIDAIPADKGILFLPDFFLGAHVRRMRPDRRIEVWMGECHVHKGIRAETLNAARREHPDAEVLVHPECGCAGQLIYEMGQGDMDPRGLHIASTEGMIRAVTERPAPQFIVATETGIMHRMRQMAPDKQFIAADPEAVCAFMKTITLPGVRDSLALDRYHITVPPDIAARARGAIDRMVALGAVSADAERIAAVALAEDGELDVTTAVTVPAGSRRPKAASSTGAAACWRAPPTPTRWRGPATAGSSGARPTAAWCAAGTVVGVVRGQLARILRAERPLLNLLQRASGIATATRAYVDAVAGHLAAGSSTPGRPRPGFGRSTSPPCSPAAARATALDLSHEVMVKDNHWQALRRTGDALAAALAEARCAGHRGALGGGRVGRAARAGLRGRRDPAAGGQPVAGDGARRGPARARTLRAGHRDRGDGRDHAGQRAGLCGGGGGLHLDRRADPQRAGGGSRRSKSRLIGDVTPHRRSFSAPTPADHARQA